MARDILIWRLIAEIIVKRWGAAEHFPMQAEGFWAHFDKTDWLKHFDCFVSGLH